jgi:hypothetical protein
MSVSSPTPSLRTTPLESLPDPKCLIQFVVLCGVSHDDIGDVDDPDLENRLVAGTLERYPLRDHPHGPSLSPHVALFCFPSGLQVFRGRSPPPPGIHSFVLTGEVTGPTYGTALISYRRIGASTSKKTCAYVTEALCCLSVLPTFDMSAALLLCIANANPDRAGVVETVVDWTARLPCPQVGGWVSEWV